jgi:uncharacterized membrane protein
MKIARSKYDILVEVSCLLCLIGSVIYLVAAWQHIPNEIPGHYNAMGEIDRITSKGSLVVLPIITWIMYAGMTVIGRFPQIWNTGVAVTEENKKRVYRLLKNMLGTLKLLIVAVFTYLTVNSSMAKPLSPLFLPVFLIVMFGSLIFFIVKLVKVK